MSLGGMTHQKESSSSLAGSGLAIIDDRLAAASSIVSTIDSTLRNMSERLYDPTPAVGMHDGRERDPVPVSNTIEARLTELVARLRVIEALAARLLG